MSVSNPATAALANMFVYMFEMTEEYRRENSALREMLLSRGLTTRQLRKEMNARLEHGKPQPSADEQFANLRPALPEPTPPTAPASSIQPKGKIRGMIDQVAVPKFVGKPEAKPTIAPILNAVLGPGPSVGRTRHDTWQGRLPQELRLRGIRTVEAANAFLREHFLVRLRWSLALSATSEPIPRRRG